MIARIVLAAIVVIVASCDQRRCDVATDCVTGETCSEGVCTAEGEGSAGEGEGNVVGEGEGEVHAGEGEGNAGGEGEGVVGEGEGEGANVGGACVGVTCGASEVCDDLPMSPNVGECVPPAGTVFQCANVLGGGDQSIADGPVIWVAGAGNVVERGADCGDASLTKINMSFFWIDSVGTTSFTGSSQIVVHVDVDSAHNYFGTVTANLPGDQSHPGKGGMVQFDVCVPVDTTQIEFDVDDDDIGNSNTLCFTR